EVGELGAVAGHVLGASGVQIPENNLDNLHSIVEDDGTLEIVDPQDLLGSFLSADIDLLILELLTGTLFLDSLGCDPLALVGKFTHVEDIIGLLETTFEEVIVLIERIKSLSGNLKEEKIKKELEEIETINIELDHRVTKLVTEKEHLKQTYKHLYDSIQSLPVRSRTM
nr:hypothetical protein [Tanacetum cinerariifolium]